MNYHKNTDSSGNPRPQSRKLKINSVSVLLTKHGFRVEVTHPLPETGEGRSRW
ncbi:MAG: hypothetical protein H7Y12_09385 [Sphingobacteriaceae bacterium]|nr:hypothetical protein [Cytophagaceae bacterium]